MSQAADIVISGMTGFGRAEGAGQGWTWAVEARSVNGRNLEVRYRGPNGFEGLERAAKAAAQARLARGQVSLNVHLRRTVAAEATLTINETLLNRYLTLANQLAGQGATPPTADGLLALRGVVEAPEEEDDADARSALEGLVTRTVEDALDALKLSRLGEGALLAPVLRQFIDQIEQLVGQAEQQAKAQIEAVRDRFSRRMAELAPETPGLQERIFLEAAALATKADVREELDRLAAHIASARQLLMQAPAGRKLDFLTQEFMREANTLCSKSATTELTAVGLDLKAVIEQFREQVQNVE